MIRNDPTPNLNLLGWLMHGTGMLTIVVCGVVFYFVVYAPLESRREQDEERARHVQRLIEDADDVFAEHERMSAAVDKFADRAASVRRRIPDDPNETEFLKTVTQAAKDTGLEIRDYRRGRVEAKERHWQLEITVSGAGTYESICRFLDRIEAMPRITKVKTLAITSSAQSEVYPADITFVLYFGLQQESAPAKEARRG